jgi:hypothetical protein
MGDDRDPDDIDDSMGANPEPEREDARAGLGYEETTAPRTRKPRGDKVGRYEIVFREGASDAPLNTGLKECRHCREKASILHAVGSGIERTHCGKCAGDWNRSRLGGG